MNRKAYAVFSEGTIAGMKTKNRLVRSATFEASMARNGRVTRKMLELYRDLAEGGVGMIITSHMAVMPRGRGWAGQFSIWSDEFIPEIARIADTVHRHGEGCRAVAQLSHVGRQVLKMAVMVDRLSTKPVGPSAVPSPLLKMKARELSPDEIRQVIRAFADAVVRVKKAGYDGVQIHAAHGWLLSSFLSPYTNRRTDDYGGPLPNRVRIIKEIVAGARERAGDFPILIKINCDDHVGGGITIDSFPQLAAEIEKTGVDAIEVSGGMWDCLVRSEEDLGFPQVPIPEARTRIDTAEKQSYFLKYAEKLKLSVPLLLVGGNRNIEQMERIMKAGPVSFLSLARPLICEPALPKRWLVGEGSDAARCVSCNCCLMSTTLRPFGCVYEKNRIMRKLLRLGVRNWRIFFK
jgi:2,4-dienoyl-CoA reductase-like NADH-dependent reductase (Old Yellow Enzyme family)